MRILVYTVNYKPELTGIGKYTSEMCEWLAARGHTITVIAPPPYYPQWRVDPPHRAWLFSTSTIDRVRVRRAPIWIPRRPGGLARIGYALSFAISSIPLLFWEACRRPDALLVIEPSFLNSPLAWIAAKISGATAWLHVQDFEIDLAYDLGQLRRGRALARAVESWITRRFDIVSSISARMVRRALAKGVERSRLMLLPNWFDPAIIFPSAEPSFFRARLGIPPDFLVALYSGSLGAKQGVEMILKAARALRHLPLRFVICGEGVAEPALKAAAADQPNVSFLPLQPVEKLNALLALADLHLLPQRRGTAESVLPSKLIGMLASGRPVVAMAARDVEIADLVRGCGTRVDHDDGDGFAAAILDLATNPGKRRSLGENARERALARFQQDAVLGQMEEQLLFRCASTLSNAPGIEPSGRSADVIPERKAAAAADQTR